MKVTRLTVVGSIAVLLALVLIIRGVFWLQFPGPRINMKSSGDASATEARKSQMLVEWQSAKAVPLSGQKMDREIDLILQRPSNAPPPDKAPKVDPGSLTQPEKADLHEAIGGLLRAYAGGRAETFMSYTKGRGEHPNPTCVPMMREVLVAANGWTREKAARGGDWDVALEYWAANCRPEWESYLADSGTLLLWRAKDIYPEQTSTYFSRSEENRTFKNMVTINRQFEPEGRKIETVLREDGPVLMADIRLVICYGPKRMGEPRPHFIRFWYDSKAGLWHPMSLCFVCTVDGTYPPMVF